MDFSNSDQNEIRFLELKNEREIPDDGNWSKSEADALEESTEGENLPKISGFRTLLPQILAVSTINLVLLDLGMILAFPTIIIPDLLNSTEELKFTEEQASWFGSVEFLCQPLGSLFSGYLFDPVGRKKTMMYVNIPLMGGWLLIHFSSKVSHLYIGGIIMGIGIGFLDAPHITYLGEVTQPKWRGILTSYAELCVALGFCFVYFMGTSANWRTVSAISAAIPVITSLLITQIPESPIWLLSKGRKKDAERSLCWLRGWVKPKHVRKEFLEIIRHNKASCKDKSLTESQPLNLNHRKTGFSGFLCKIGGKRIAQKSVLRPLFLVAGYFGFSHAAGVTSTRPFMVDILREFGTPLEAKWVTAISSVIGIAGYITGMLVLRKTGKRLLSLISMFGCAIICAQMAVYGFFFTHLNVPLILVVLFVLLNFVWSAGIGQVPWMLISEIFPFSGRGLASGISAALSYIFAFIFTKTYYATYNSFTLPGVFGFYAGCTFLGGLFLYYFLPETEGKTLEQVESIVEEHFNNFKRRNKNVNGT